MNKKVSFPIRHENSILEATSERFFRSIVPIAWIIDKPVDFGIDLIISPVIHGDVIGLNFSVQLKAQKNVKGKLETRLKKSTINYLLNRLEPVMIILFDEKTEQAYWNWIISSDFDLTKNVSTYSIRFNKEQNISNINWEDVLSFIQKVFKTKNCLLTSLEYDLFNTASDLETKAWSHYFNRNLNEASFYFSRLVLQAEPKSIWLVALAQCQYQIFDYQNAIVSINRALEVDRNDSILLTKGCILAEDGMKSHDARKLSKAEKIFRELYSKDPNAVHAFNYANVTSRLNKLPEAEKLYKQALKLNPNYAEAWKNLGQVYYDLKKHDQEMKCYNNALRINPELMQAKFSKAITSGFVYKKYENAIKTILECISNYAPIFSEFPMTFYWLGLFYFKCRKTELALKWINKGLDHDLGDAWLINLKANVLFECIHEDKLLDEAVSFFAENYHLNNDDPVNFFYLCTAIIKRDGQLKALDIATSWLRGRQFVFGADNDSVNDLTFQEAICIIKHWNIIQTYAVQYSVEKIKLEFEYIGIPNYKQVLQLLDIKRMLFIANLIDLLNKSTNRKDVKKRIIELYHSTFLSIDKAKICDLITTPNTKTEKFADDLSKVTVTLSQICTIESTRCLGFVIGSRKYEKEIPLLNTLIDPSLLTDTILFYIEMFYLHFDLPME